MKILIVISNPAIGGTETFILSITPYLENMGCDIEIVNTWNNSMMKKPAFEANLSYKELDGNNRYISLKNIAQIVSIIRRNKYNIVLVFGLRVSVLMRLLKSFFRDIPLITGLREVDMLRSWFHTWLDRLTKGNCDLFIANSNAVAQMFIAREKISRNKMVVIQNGINPYKFNKLRFQHINKCDLGLPTDKIIITTVANLRYEKGHDFYIETIKTFLGKFENSHFVWIGKGPLKPRLEKEIRSIGYSDKVTFMGSVEDVRPVLACSDVFVLPSREEGMPRALMEAMAMSLPCVATNVGGVNEVAENGISGLIANFGDVENFGRHLISFIHDEDLRRRMGNAARVRVMENFDIEKIAKKYIKIFKLLCLDTTTAKKSKCS